MRRTSGKKTKKRADSRRCNKDGLKAVAAEGKGAKGVLLHGKDWESRQRTNTRDSLQQNINQNLKRKH